MDHKLVKKIIDGTPKYIEVDGFNSGWILRWGEPGKGWGEITFYYDDNFNIKCDSETMSKEFVLQKLTELVEQAYDNGLSNKNKKDS